MNSSVIGKWLLATATALAVTIALSGCKGVKGDTGTQGPKGDPGAGCVATTTAAGKTITCPDGTQITVKDGLPGTNGKDGQDALPDKDTGTISGTLVADVGGPASGVTVATSPDSKVSVVSDAQGEFSLVVPIGVYTVTLTSPDYAEKDLPAISVTGGSTFSILATVTRINPLKLTPTTALQQVGFNQQVTLSVDVAGATAPTYTWKQTGGPTTVVLSSTTVDKPTFTTAAFADIVASNTIKYLDIPSRSGFLGITNQQLVDMSWTFEVAVVDGKFSAKATVTVSPTSIAAGIGNHPKGVRLIANDAPGASYNWSLSAPAGSQTALDDKTLKNPSFIPDLTGSYTLTNGTTSLALNVGTYVGVDEPNHGCAKCHEGGQGGDQVTEWRGTGHATLFHDGIEGKVDHYSGDCIRCHTVGYNDATLADNGGFDDVARKDGWSFPATPAAGEYDKMPADLKYLASIQCENCHGPGSDHGASLITPSKDLKSANVCGTCHDAPPFHTLFSLWSQSAHSKRDLALQVGTVDARGATAAHCGRCHTSQGFDAYLPQLVAGKGDQKLLEDDGVTPADVTYMTGLGMTNASVEPTTCQTCHDPHSLKLNLEGDVPLLAAGFGVFGVGEGSLCMSCHNTRNGLHDDAHLPADYSAPHTPSQTDVLMGQNAYFVKVGDLSAHAAIGDTCVQCHVRLVPTALGSATSNHTFAADTTICAKCHGDGVTGAAQQAKADQGIADLKAGIEGDVLKTLTAAVGAGKFTIVAYDPTTDWYSAYGVSPAPAVPNIDIAAVPTKVEIEEIHGVTGFKLTLPAPVTITFKDSKGVSSKDVTSAEVHFQLSGLLVGTGNPYAASSVLVKAAWNYWLIVGDGSKAIHNPDFVYGIIDATKAALGI
jgi:hypothetical protein